MAAKDINMRYDEFKKLIENELLRHPAGLTWAQLKTKLNLPYNRPCPTWIMQMEKEIGLSRIKETQRAAVWKILPNQ
jgi:hypothetical protein